MKIAYLDFPISHAEHKCIHRPALCIKVRIKSEMWPNKNLGVLVADRMGQTYPRNLSLLVCVSIKLYMKKLNVYFNKTTGLWDLFITTT